MIIPNWTIALHGGAGTLERSSMSEALELQYREALSMALQTGIEILSYGGSALDAVEQTVVVLENSPLFNAGKGSVFTHKGQHEMDASIMDGKNLHSGAIAGVMGLANPVTVARKVMENTEHVLLVGVGAMEFAKQQGFEFLNDDYFYNEWRFKQWQQALIDGKVQLDHTPLNEKKFGTVGAVARDVNGNLAAATSTGGMTNKKFGRVGDTPIIGSGTYANNRTCAVSCTGNGEYFIRGVVAYDLSCLMEYKGLSIEEAGYHVVNEKLIQIGGEGGLIAIDSNGKVCFAFNTEGMYRAMATPEQRLIAIYGDEEI